MKDIHWQSVHSRQPAGCPWLVSSEWLSVLTTIFHDFLGHVQAARKRRNAERESRIHQQLQITKTSFDRGPNRVCDRICKYSNKGIGKLKWLWLGGEKGDFEYLFRAWIGFSGGQPCLLILWWRSIVYVDTAKPNNKESSIHDLSRWMLSDRCAIRDPGGIP